LSDPEKLVQELAPRTLTLTLLPLLAGAVCAAVVFFWSAPRSFLALACGGIGAIVAAAALVLRRRIVRATAKQAISEAVDSPISGVEAVKFLRSLRKLTEEAQVAGEARLGELEKAVSEIGSLLREAAGLHALMGEKLHAAEEACRGAMLDANAKNENVFEEGRF
jgi:F0F1-type ATP synthase assembly protein I